MFAKNRLHTNVWPLAFAVSIASYTSTTAADGSLIAGRTFTAGTARATAPQTSLPGKTIVQFAQVQLLSLIHI